MQQDYAPEQLYFRPGGTEVKPSYLWDYDIDEETFQEVLAGNTRIGRLDRDWAAVRLLEHAPYKEIRRLLGFPGLIEGWPRWRNRIRSESRKRGFDFIAEWIPLHHPELLVDSEHRRRDG